jgi:iron(III) transport system ATP-binding protein
VAEFLGMADFIPGTATTQGLQTDFGLIRQPVPGEPGRPLEVMVRPHDLAVTADAHGVGVVVAREFRGAENLYTVRMPDGYTVRTSQDHTQLLPLGASVTVRCEPGHALTCFEGGQAVICPQECDLPGLSNPRATVGVR